MKGREGYYSLIQYCPDRSRAEAANVGILLFVPGESLLRARVTEYGKRAKQMFHLSAVESRRLSRAARAIADRVGRSETEIQTTEELQQFIDTRANDIRITDPRLVKVVDIDADVERLFGELVEVDQHDAAAALVAPEVSLLDNTFGRLIEEHRAIGPQEIVVPVRGKTIEVPYAYRNGVLNLVKPEKFNKKSDKAIDEASLLAIDGDLLHENPEGDGPRQLIVVSAAKPTPKLRETESRLADLFSRYHVRFVPGDKVEEFAAEVEASAH